MFNPERLSPTVRLGIIMLLLTGALLMLLGRHTYEHSRAVPIMLQTAPVDPRSIFQGDFVTLSYEISRLSARLFDGDKGQKQGWSGDGLIVRAGQPVYVALKDAGLIWTDLRASFKPIAEVATGERVETRTLTKKGNDWRISQLMNAQAEGDNFWREEHWREGRSYYVVSKQIGPVWQPVRASVHPLTAQPGEVILRGKALTSTWGKTDGLRVTELPSPWKEADIVRVTYGIEAFFVPEGEGQWIDRLGWNGQRNRMLVRVKVSPSGTGYTDNIVFDGRDMFQNSGLDSWTSWRE